MTQPLDELARYNQAQWDELSRRGVVFSRPWLDLDPATAWERINPEGVLRDVAGKEVLCLAASGGQQSAAFALLGAQVTVFDLSAEQLRKDRETAAHYGLTVRTVQGDMRDLSVLPADAFDIVWQAHSINFVPDPHTVFAQVARVIRHGGIYRVSIHNPIAHVVDDEAWHPEHGYPLRHPYRDEEIDESIFRTQGWNFEGPTGQVHRLPGPREFRHTLSTIFNGLVAHGFVLVGLGEELNDIPDPEPGTWEHFKMVAAPYLRIWCTYRPDVLPLR